MYQTHSRDISDSDFPTLNISNPRLQKKNIYIYTLKKANWTGSKMSININKHHINNNRLAVIYYLKYYF